MSDEFTFTDSRFMTAKEKAKVIKAWARFLKGDCKRNHFTKALYGHLMNNCSFMAHYNLHGFYDHYFAKPEMKRKFFSQFDKAKDCRSVELGWCEWISGEYYDLNTAMVAVAAGYIARITAAVADEVRDRDLAQARNLLLKHGLGDVADQIPMVPVITDMGLTSGTQLSLM